MCLLCPCKSEIPVKFSSLCFCGERQKVPSFLHALLLLLPSLECGRDCSAARSGSGAAAAHSLLATKRQRAISAGAAGPSALRCEGWQAQGLCCSFQCPCSGFPGARALGAQRMGCSKGMLLGCCRQSAAVIVLLLIILSSLEKFINM